MEVEGMKDRSISKIPLEKACSLGWPGTFSHRSGQKKKKKKKVDLRFQVTWSLPILALYGSFTSFLLSP